MAELSTERLHLTPVSAADFDDLARIWRDEAFVRFITGRTLTGEEVWLRLLRDIGHWQVMGFGNWAIRLRSTGAMIGTVGLFDYRRNIQPAFSAPEVGWGLDPAHQGQGLASEALSAALGHADIGMGFERTQCIIGAENVPSLKLANALGFAPLGEASYNGNSVGMFERLKAG